MIRSYISNRVFTDNNFALIGIQESLEKANLNEVFREINWCIVVITDYCLIDLFQRLSSVVNLLQSYELYFIISTEERYLLINDLLSGRGIHINIHSHIDEISNEIEKYSYSHSQYKNWFEFNQNKVMNENFSFSEKRVMELMNDGFSMVHISKITRLNIKTISYHKRSAMRKLRAYSNTALLLKYRLLKTMREFIHS